MNKYKPVVAIKPCEFCGSDMPIRKYYEQKRFCTAKCRSLVIRMPPRPDQTGFTPWNKGLDKSTDDRIKKIAEGRMGASNWQWTGGLSRSHRTSWSTAVHKKWRKYVFARDDYTCQMCFVRGGSLQADHIKCFAHHPDLRYEIGNGRTLCESCHKTTYNFGMHKREICV